MILIGFSVVSNLCKFCTSFFFCQLPILKDVLEMLGHYASVYIKKLCDPILSQPDLAILHTDFNTVVTGILMRRTLLVAQCVIMCVTTVLRRIGTSPPTRSQSRWRRSLQATT